MLDFDEALMNADAPEDIKKLKTWMFEEQVRIQAKQDELQDFNRELIFIAKKQKIIEDAYQQLALDRKALECERLNFEHERSKYRRQKMTGSKPAHQSYESAAYDGTSFFRGVDNDMALRKRYKELLKIFHPDNECGDTKTLLLIQTEYESLKSRYYGS